MVQAIIGLTIGVLVVVGLLSAVVAALSIAWYVVMGIITIGAVLFGLGLIAFVLRSGWNFLFPPKTR